MRVRIWPILVLGFGVLVALVALSGRLALVRATAIYAGISRLHEAEHQTETLLTELRSDIAISAILVRDILLDPASAGTVRPELQHLRSRTASSLKQVGTLVPEQQTGKLETLQQQVNGYWRSLEPMFQTFPREQRGFAFVQAQIVPRRQAALKVIEEVERLNAASFKQRRHEIDARNAGLTVYVEQVVLITLLIALAVAGVSVFRIYSLEKVALLQHQQVKDTEQELRRLSGRLVRAQEEERRALSRDLHDQVGQVLTALRISLGNLSLSPDGTGGKVDEELELAKRLLTQVLRSTHDLAMALRPSMLDDLGLEAALEWLARQHGKVSGTPVALQMQGSFHALSEAQRTCVYRIVQEALNNAAKHAQANNVAVNVTSSGSSVGVEICDDGVGIRAGGKAEQGLGLLGMKERIRHLGGELSIAPGPLAGTTVKASFPVVHDLVQESA